MNRDARSPTGAGTLRAVKRIFYFVPIEAATLIVLRVRFDFSMLAAVYSASRSRVPPNKRR